MRAPGRVRSPAQPPLASRTALLVAGETYRHAVGAAEVQLPCTGQRAHPASHVPARDGTPSARVMGPKVLVHELRCGLQLGGEPLAMSRLPLPTCTSQETLRLRRVGERRHDRCPDARVRGLVTVCERGAVVVGRSVLPVTSWARVHASAPPPTLTPGERRAGGLGRRTRSGGGCCGNGRRRAAVRSCQGRWAARKRPGHPGRRRCRVRRRARPARVGRSARRLARRGQAQLGPQLGDLRRGCPRLSVKAQSRRSRP